MNQEPRLTIPSMALEVWRRLYERYRLEPEPASVGPDVSKTIQPTTNADDLLARPRGVVGTASIAGTGAALLATVPDGIRWRIFSLHARRVTGDFDFDRIILRDLVNNLDIIISSFGAAASRNVVSPLGPLLMNPGDTIRTNVSVFVSSGTMAVHLWLAEEDFF